MSLPACRGGVQGAAGLQRRAARAQWSSSPERLPRDRAVVEPRIYHITHVENLPEIIAEGRLVCAAEVLRHGGPPRGIGLSAIERRRIEEIEVSGQAGTKVGGHVPCYFYARSSMLYVIHKENLEGLTYRDGQEDIVHLEAYLRDVVEWADHGGVPRAFSLSNAGAHAVEFRTGLENLAEPDWKAIAATDFREPRVRYGKQAEILLQGGLPWHLIRRIGVRNSEVERRVRETILSAIHQPFVEVLRS